MRSAMRAASQLPGRGPTDVDDAIMISADNNSRQRVKISNDN